MSRKAPAANEEDAARTFNSEVEAGRLPYAGTAAEIAYGHRSVKGFRVVVSRPDALGNVQRNYAVRYGQLDSKGNTRDKKHKLGSVGVLEYGKALALAADYMERARDARASGKPVLPSLRQAFDDYIVFKTTIVAKEKQLKSSTVDDYQQRFKDLIPADWYGRPIDELTPERWALLRRDCTTNASYAARGRKQVSESRFDIMLKGAISGLYRRQQASHPGLVNPVPAMRRDGIISRNKEKHEFITTEALPEVWRYVETEIRRPQRDITLIGLLTGWRLQLICRIPLDRIKPAKKAVEWRSSDPGGPYAESDGNEFDYPISDLLWDEVFAPRLARIQPGQTYLIESGRIPGKPFGDIGDSLAKLDNLAGCHISAHVLRKTFGTLAPSAGVPQRTISHLMMHKTSAAAGASAMTASYQKRDFLSMKAGANQYANYFAALVGMNSTGAPLPAPAAIEGITADKLAALQKLAELPDDLLAKMLKLAAALS